MGRSSRIRIGCLLLALALVAPAGGLARSGHGHKRRRPAHGKVCPPHVKRVKGRCVARLGQAHGSTVSVAEKGAFTIAAGPGLRPVPRRAYRHVPRPLRSGLPPLLTGRAASTVAARTSSLAAAKLGSSVPSGRRASLAHAAAGTDGWNVKVSDVGGSRDENRIGDQDAHGTATATKDAIVDGLDVHGEISMTEHRRQLVDRCPSSDGTVPGDGVERYSFSLAASKGRAEASVTVDLNPQFTYVGHVDDTGKLRSFDAKMHFTVLAYGGDRGSDGKLYSQEPPRLYVIDAQRDGIDPDRPFEGFFDEHFGGRMTAHAVLGHIIWQDDVAPKLKKLAEELFSLHVAEVGDLYKEAEHGWQTPGTCVNVALSTPSTKVAPTATVPVTATITGLRQAAKQLATGTYTATADAGAITPPSGTYSGTPIHLSYTAPSVTSHPRITVITQSRQGKGEALLDLQVQAPTYALRYTHSSQLDYDGPPERIAAAPRSGTEDLHEAWALTSTIPLTGDATTGLSGTGPLTYSSPRYHLEWQGTFTGQASCNGTYTIDLTGTTPGSAQVRKLTFSSPADIALQFDVGQQSGASGGLPPESTETFHTVQTYDVCPGASWDDTYGQWNADWNVFYARAGLLGGTTVTVAQLDSGWQPGQGNVVAQRTVTGSFPWNGAPGGSASTSTWADTYQIIAQTA